MQIIPAPFKLLPASSYIGLVTLLPISDVTGMDRIKTVDAKYLERNEDQNSSATSNYDDDKDVSTTMANLERKEQVHNGWRRNSSLSGVTFFWFMMICCLRCDTKSLLTNREISHGCQVRRRWHL